MPGLHGQVDVRKAVNMKHGTHRSSTATRQDKQQAADTERGVLAGTGRQDAAHLQKDDEDHKEVEAPKGDQHARGSNPGRTFL